MEYKALYLDLKKQHEIEIKILKNKLFIFESFTKIKIKCSMTEHRTWRSLLGRCYNTRNPDYHNYGGRGITVCSRWKNSFVDFLLDMGFKANKRDSIDRIDNNGNYEPGNCRWATKTEQNRNKRTNRILTINGEKATVAAWSEKFGINPRRVYDRLSKGWSEKDAVFKSVKKYKKTSKA